MRDRHVSVSYTHLDVYKRQGEERQKLAFILGGETVVTLRGDGMGGRNQEIALASVPYLANVPGSLVFSVGSDGTCLLYTSRCV